MRQFSIPFVAVFMAAALAVPTMASPPGNYSITVEHLIGASIDFNEGVGVADPTDPSNPCTAVLLGLPGPMHFVENWGADQNMGTNLNGLGVAVNNLVPLLPSAGGGASNSGGINLGVPCPVGSAAGNLWLVWSGMNWRSVQAGSSTQISLCTQQTFASSSPGCLALDGGNLALYATACDASTVTFGHDYSDNKGKYLAGQPFDTLAMKNDQIRCAAAHSHDYTNTVRDFGLGSAAQTFDIIKNEAVVHAASGTTYMVVCWSIDYADFTNPLAPVILLAQTHDWKLILDLADPADGYQAALQLHYGGQRTGDVGAGATVAMRGFYSQDSTGAGQNGFGPCTAGPAAEGTQFSDTICIESSQRSECLDSDGFLDRQMLSSCEQAVNEVPGSNPLQSVPDAADACISEIPSGTVTAVSNLIAHCMSMPTECHQGPPPPLPLGGVIRIEYHGSTETFTWEEAPGWDCSPTLFVFRVELLCEPLPGWNFVCQNFRTSGTIEGTGELYSNFIVAETTCGGELAHCQATFGVNGGVCDGYAYTDPLNPPLKCLLDIPFPGPELHGASATCFNDP